ncbi:MAG: biotin transporter BioY [Firmicutes bacterium]|nr:biotin transporter BioY [Bacillota bacterium]
MSLSELSRSGLLTALIAVLARLSIPLPFSPVPVTGQLIGVLLAGVLLGGKNSFFAVLSYLMLGAAGAPLFSYGLGGPGILFGPSGGYLWGFLPGVFICGKLLENERAPRFPRTAAAMLGCLGCTYLGGTVQLALVMGFGAAEAVLAGVLPFLPADLLKIAFAATVGARLKKSITPNVPLPSPPAGQSTGGKLR